MKKFLSGILLATFLFNIIGYYFVLSFKIELNRIAVLKEMSSRKMYSIETKYFSVAEFNKYKTAGDEILIDNVMYDIVSVKNTGEGTVMVTCFTDKKETRLYTELKAFFEDNFDKDATNDKKSKDNFKTEIKDFSPSYYEPLAVYFKSETTGFAFEDLYSSFTGTIITPPPQVTNA